jgi:quinol monooxygenase YgiN
LSGQPERSGDMSQLSFRLVVHLVIKGGELQRFKKIAKDFTSRVEAGEPDTVCFEWYVSDVGTDCYLVESYDSSEAFLLHLSKAGDMLESLAEVSPIDNLLVLGEPNEEVKEALSKMGAKFYPLIVGCTR